MYTHVLGPGKDRGLDIIESYFSERILRTFRNQKAMTGTVDSDESSKD